MRLRLMLVILVLVSLGVLHSCGSSSTQAPSEKQIPLEDVAQRSGLDFWQFSGATGDLFMTEIMGSGGAFIDYDNDGDLDVYLVQGAPAPQNAKPVIPLPAGWKPGNRLFRNDWVPGGKLSFTDVTEQAGVGYIGQGMGVAVGDYDNDGHADLYVTNYASKGSANVLYHNNGNGTFTDVTAAAGVASSGWPTSTAFLDYDRDGFLDLAVVRYVEFAPRACTVSSGQKEYCGPQNFPPTVSQLFHNLGNGRFQEVTAAVGLNAKQGAGLGILTGDFDGDGWPDFVVANDMTANRLWLNEGANGGRRVFRDVGLEQGVAYASDGRPRAGMGLADGDIYGEGGEALVVTNLLSQGFTLFYRQPGSVFVDSTLQAGLFNTSLPYTGFGVGFVDLENRGLLDLFAANGDVLTVASEAGEPYPYRQRNLLLRNLGKGRGFEDVTASSGPALEPVEVSRAAVFGDVNNDGGIDVLVTNNNGPARLLLNVVPRRGHWLEVRVEGTHANRSGYGSVVELFRKDGRSMQRYVRGDGSYLAANDPRVHFGLGESAEVDRIEVHWLGGACEAWSPVTVDHMMQVREGSGKACAAAGSAARP